ncbi:hypothetical protein QQS21_001497 [Conoideocrella luteorostrata]|uniref:FAD-binding domain-containing protein n=1 Tax=Conoideocrella luteorostrata TaxID=1105319 RepID=A0AAJ0CZP7_9HYPO|nr:hypothetical protein QQS21_001497 [Conoideocrella luteorostrata]
MLQQADPKTYLQREYKSTPPYVKDRVCTMSDAAHAMTPFIASGAANAFEDAMVLAALLNALSPSEDIAGAFRTYDAAGRPRYQTIVDTSKELGYMRCGVNKDAGQDPRKPLQIMGTWWEFLRNLHNHGALDKFIQMRRV